MDYAVLRKRLNTYKTSEGRLQNVADEVIIDVLRAWEHWTGSTADLYRELGLSKMQMCIMLKKGKKLIKNGVVLESEFHEIGQTVAPGGGSVCSGRSEGIEITWQQGQLIRFSQVDQLIDFLKKVA